MAHAQVELYPQSRDDEGLSVGPWGWRKVVFVEPPEILEDSGLVFADRAEAMAAALERFPAWPIG